MGEKKTIILVEQPQRTVFQRNSLSKKFIADTGGHMLLGTQDGQSAESAPITCGQSYYALQWPDFSSNTRTATDPHLL